MVDRFCLVVRAAGELVEIDSMVYFLDRRYLIFEIRGVKTDREKALLDTV